MAYVSIRLTVVAVVALAFQLIAWAAVPMNDKEPLGVIETPADERKLEIDSVEIRYSGNDPASLLVKGKYFGNAVAGLQLSDIDLSPHVTLWSDIMIEADLLSHTIVPGTYIVKVQIGVAPVFRDEIDVTIGTVGPEGPPGPKGDTGDPGPQGFPGTAPFLGLSCPAGQALIGFDAAGQLICGTFISDPLAIGPWPQFQSKSATADPTATASCEMTDAFITNMSFCTSGWQLQGPLILTSRYTEVRVDAGLIDPQSTPVSNDIEVVTNQIYNGPFQRSQRFLMLDDGSMATSSMYQVNSRYLLDCSITGTGAQEICSCNALNYEIESGDTTAADNLFTASFGVGDSNSFSSQGSFPLFIDCIAMANKHLFFTTTDGDNRDLQFELRADDQAGNVTVLPHSQRPEITFGDVGIECSGDPCACCVLLNVTNPRDPVANGGCLGLPGLTFDSGTYCRQVFIPPFMPLVPPAFLGMPCTSDADCNNVSGSCRQSPFGRSCPNGFCMTDSCLRIL